MNKEIHSPFTIIKRENTVNYTYEGIGNNTNERYNKILKNELIYPSFENYFYSYEQEGNVSYKSIMNMNINLEDIKYKKIVEDKMNKIKNLTYRSNSIDIDYMNVITHTDIDSKKTQRHFKSRSIISKMNM